MANISTIKVGNTSYGITATPTAHASTATTYGAASASNYGHVKLSDNYTSSAGTAASGIAASSAAVYNAYNTLNSNLEAITPSSIYAIYGSTHHFASEYSDYWNSTNSYYEFPIPIQSGSGLWKYGSVIVSINRSYDNGNYNPHGQCTFIAYSSAIAYPSSKTWQYSTLLASNLSTGGGGNNPTSISVILNNIFDTEVIVRVPLSSKWSTTSIKHVSISVLFL